MIEAEEACVHEQVSVFVSFTWTPPPTLRGRVAAGGGLVQHEAVERDCAGSWRWTQWVRDGVDGYREG